MYRYDEFDQQFVAQRAAQFRRQVKRRLAGELTEDQFRPLRLMNGLYLQLHAYMLRVNTPYGTMSSRQMRQLAHVARKYDRGFGHFTTRQNIQYNWIKLEDAPDAIADLGEAGSYVDPVLGQLRAQHHVGPIRGPREGRARRSARLLRATAPVFVPASRVLLPAAQVQDRDHGLAERSRGGRDPRHRPADAQQRAWRDGIRGARRRRLGPHAVHRPDDPQMARAGAPAVVRRGDLARVQHARPPRQHPQGADQDHREPDGHRQISRARRQGVGAHEGRPAEGSGRRGRAHQGVFRAAALREARRTVRPSSPRCARPTAASTAGCAATWSSTRCRATRS